MYATTFVLASKKHPYLIYSGILSAAAGVWGVRQRVLENRITEEGSESVDAENAEVVKDRILRLRDWIGLCFTGVGFVVAIVGGYGEGFTD